LGHLKLEKKALTIKIKILTCAHFRELQNGMLLGYCKITLMGQAGALFAKKVC
jgi:hypothetical protein